LLVPDILAIHRERRRLERRIEIEWWVRVLIIVTMFGAAAGVLVTGGCS
jgi:hypothetical protein